MTSTSCGETADGPSSASSSAQLFLFEAEATPKSSKTAEDIIGRVTDRRAEKSFGEAEEEEEEEVELMGLVRATGGGGGGGEETEEDEGGREEEVIGRSGNV